MWFWLALAAMFCWSGSDIFSKIGSRPDDKYSHWKMIITVGGVMGILAMYQIFVDGVQITFQDILQYLPASFLYILSMILGYVGLRYIELSISSPICNSSGAIAALMCFLFLGQRMSIPQTGAVILVCAGVVMLGIVESREDESIKLERQKRENTRYAKSFLALLLPVLYCLLDAGGTFADAVILETMEESVALVAYELTFLFMAVVAAIYTFGIKRDKLSIPREAPKLTAAICETVGQVAYTYAIKEYAIGAAPIISAYCLVSILWSRIFLKEKLSWKHYLAIAIAAVGIVALGIMDEIG